MKKPIDITPLDVLLGIEESKKLMKILVEALLKYQDEESHDLNQIFLELIEKDETSSELFDKLDKILPSRKYGIRFIIRCAILVLDNEVSHDLISILVGFDVRGIIVGANCISKLFASIMFSIEDLSEDEEGGIALVLYEELCRLKTILENK
jgi:hypothetical protein